MSLSGSVRQVIVEQWSFLVEATFQPTAQGSSNATYFVDTPNKRFILKFYSEAKTAQIQYEYSLLTFLQHTDLPFAAPVQIDAAGGETLISVELDGQPLTVALLPCLVGQPLDRRNLAQI